MKVRFDGQDYFVQDGNGLNKSGGVVDALDDAEYDGSVISLIDNVEALINALAYRDYLVNGSEVHIFARTGISLR